MKNFSFVKDILPHLIAIIVFAIITVGYFSPVFFQNESINQYDIQQWYGSAHELEEFREQTGEEGLWAGSTFSGMPGYLISIDWSNGIIEGLQKIYTLWMPHPVKYIFAAFLSFYILLLSFKVRPYLAIAGAVAYGLSSFLIIGLAAGHNARIGAIAFMPLVVAGVHLLFSGKRWIGFGLTALGLALELRVNHLQITYYLFLILVVYGLVALYEAYKNKELKGFGISAGVAILAALIAIGTFFGEFWGTYEYSKYSIRGASELSSTVESGENEDGLDKSYAFNYSNGIFEPLTLMIPNFMGGASSNYFASDTESETFKALQRSGDQQTASQLARFSGSYWGKQPLSAPYYAGAITCFFFMIGILLAERKYKVWLLVVFGLGIILSWGSNFSSFNYFVFDYLPGYNKFRSVTFTITMVIFAIGLLGMIGLENFFLKKDPQEQKKLFLAWALSGGFCLLLIVIAGMFNYGGLYDDQLPAWFTAALREDRIALLRTDAFRSFIFITIAGAILFAYLKSKIVPLIAGSVLVLLVTIDVWTVDKRYLNESSFKRNALRSFFVESEADKLISTEGSGHYRVLNLLNPFNEAKTSYFHQSLGGYHGAKMRRYQDLIEYGIQPEIQELIGNLRSGKIGFGEFGVINMLNTQYFKAGDEARMVIPNSSALGNGWFVNDLRKVSSPDEEIAAVVDINTGNTATVDISKFPVSDLNGSGAGSVSMKSYQPNKIEYDVESSEGGLAVFSEIYYPKGWVATIDGVEVPIIRANYVLRALEVPQGSHKVVFEYLPAPYLVGNKVTLVFNILLLLVMIASIAMQFRSNNSQVSEME